MTAELNEALAAAQAKFPPIPREKTVTVQTREGGKYSFAYATLDTILNAVRPALNEQGLAIVQLLEQEDGRPQIRTELRHKSGGVLGSAFPLPNVPNTPQQLGSLLTYLRRYAITALLGVAAEDDDDGRQAAQTKPAEKPAEKKPSKAQLKKLDVLVGRLRPAYLNTGHLYQAVAQLRGEEPNLEGELHWAPLRDSLDQREASEMIKRLEILEGRANARLAATQEAQQERFDVDPADYDEQGDE